MGSFGIGHWLTVLLVILLLLGSNHIERLLAAMWRRAGASRPLVPATARSLPGLPTPALWLIAGALAALLLPRLLPMP